MKVSYPVIFYEEKIGSLCVLHGLPFVFHLLFY